MPARTAGLSTLPALALILFAGLTVYSNSFAGVFVFDDEPAIAQNPDLHTLWPLTTAMSAPEGTTLSGRPTAALSFAIDRALTGGSLSGYHATNLAIHLGATLLLFGITQRTVLSSPLRDRFASSARTLSLIVAIIFVVHPLHTGSITYIVQRVESLMGLFYLATLYCAIRALDAKHRAFWAGASVLACALGMATKEVMATAPLAVMLWDRHFVRDRTAARWPLYVGLASTWIILAILVSGGHRSSAVGFEFPEWPWWRYLMTQAQVITHYLRLTLIPTPLVLDYDWRPATSLAQVAVPGIFLCALIGATIRGLVRRAPVAFAGAWFFLILAPTSSVIPIVTEVAAEHRMYLPIASVIALVVLGIFEAGRRVSEHAAANTRRTLVRAGVIGAIAVMLLFARITYERNADYHDYDRIWLQTIAERPRNARARNNYATSLLMKRRFAEAEPHLRVAVQEKPSFAEAQANLGVTLAAQGRLDEGAGHLQQAIALRPDYTSAHRNLGETYAMQHRLSDALKHYLTALEHQSDDVRLLNRASWILATAADDQLRDGGRARALAERAVTLTRRQDADSLDSLAAALAETGQFEAAAATAREGSRQARSAGSMEMSRNLERRAALYERRENYRER